MDFLWYSSVLQNNDNLEQGDFVPDCPIVIPPDSIERIRKMCPMWQDN